MQAGGVMGAMVEEDSGVFPAEVHIKINFVGGKGVEVTEIIQSWQEQGMVVHGERQVMQDTREDVGYGQRSSERSNPWRDRGFGMLGRRRGNPSWANDSVWKIDRR